MELELRPGAGPARYGEFICTSIFDDSGQTIGVHIDRADPQILISGELLAGWHRAMLSGPKPGQWHYPFPFGGELRYAGRQNCPVGDVFRIDGDNRTLVYRVTARHPDFINAGAYLAEWPD